MAPLRLAFRGVRMRAEWVVCILTLLVSGVFFTLTFSFPQLAADPAGMALFPRIASGFAALAAGAIMVRRLFRPAAPDMPANEPFFIWLRQLCRERPTRMIALSVIYPWFIIKIGFLIATAIYVFLLMRLFQARAVIAVPYAVVVASGIYVVFVYILEAYVPPGIWLELLGV